MDKFVIIDGNSLINRAFYALPLLSNSKGEFSNGVYGFANILIKGILELKPKYIAVCLDYGKKTFRNEIFKDYKGTRKETPEELRKQFPILRKMLANMGIAYVEKEGIEADDLIGTLSKKFDTENIIITGDRDCLQLIDDITQVWLTKKGITEVKMMDADAYFDDYGLKPTQVVDLKALMGDSSDNIPGVAGIGEKSALELMKTFGSLDNIYAKLDEVKPKWQQKLLDGKEMAYLSQTLSRIKTDVEIPLSLKDFEYTFPFTNPVYDFFKEYEFNSLLKRADLFNGMQEEVISTKYNANIVELVSTETAQNQVKHITRAGKLGISLTADKLSFSYDKNCEFYLDLTKNYTLLDDILCVLKPVLEDEKIEKIVYEKKDLTWALKKYGIKLNGVSFDCILGYYLLCAGEREASRANLFSHYGLEEKFTAINLFYLFDLLKADMASHNLQKLYDDVEFPLVDVLYKMEESGFKINPVILDELYDRYQKESSEMENTICQMAGEVFNINSPKQLSAILFDKLGLTAWNNKKKSTSADILEEMVDLHPIVPAIIRYRKTRKMLTTYLEPYKTILKESGDIVHTIFNQTLTNTGRLSSSEPNLQNIPVREDEFKSLRKMFVSRHSDGLLVSADYSQIELRLLAHASGDESLINAFNNNIDIHSLTASEIFGVEIQNVNSTMRRTAKAVNFGIIYGISEFGLAQNIGCTRKEAKGYIERYFARYPKIKEYMQNNVESAKKSGYAVSLFGRRRKINELNSANYMTRQFGERVAMNMPLQGTASDIIKLAMINVERELSSRNLKSELVLQVHDELIVDCVRDEAVTVAKILEESMENVVKLSVPLTVSVESGKTWFDC